MPEKILIVDDDVDSLKLMGLMLQRNGYEVIAASAGQQGLTRALGDSPDLIILDVMMPDMNGYEVCRRLRANPQTSHIPIIMFTAKTMIDDKVAGFEAGADDYLTKPTHPTELTSRVQAILKRNGKHEAPVENGSNGLNIGVVGVKGGVGTTTVAMNLAAAWMQQGGSPIITDLRPGAGHLGLYLGLRSAGGLEAVLSHQPGTINASLVDHNLTVHKSGLRALLATADPNDGLAHYDINAATTLARVLRELGNPAVFDLGAGLTPQINHLHREMDRIILLVEPNMIMLPYARALLKEFEGTDPQRVIVVVVNRNQHNLQPPWHEVERALEQDIRGIIASAPQVIYEATEAGLPVVEYKPSAIIANQLNKLAELIIEQT